MSRPLPSTVVGLAAIPVVAAAAAAQIGQGVLQPLQPLTPAAGRVWWEPEKVEGDRRISRVRWAVGDSPLSISLQAPVAHCGAALVGESGLWIMAGGNSEDLQVYAVGAEGQIQRIPTDGGRLLPRDFAGGLGSWPIADGRRLLMFAYQKGSTVQFRAVDFAGRILATRELSEDAAGFAAAFLAPSHEVRVAFEPSGEVLVFPHPDAPKVVVAPSLLVEFGAVRPGRTELRRLTLRNEGRREAVVRAAADQPTFQVREPVVLRIRPGEEGTLDLRFQPMGTGPWTGRLNLHTNTPDGLIPVALRGSLEAEVAESEPEPVAPELDPPADPELGDAEWTPDPSGGAALRGVLRPTTSAGREPPAFVLIEAEDGRALARWPLVPGPDGRKSEAVPSDIVGPAAGGLESSGLGFAGVVAELPSIEDGCWLRLEGRSGRRSAAIPLPPRWPSLLRSGESLVVRGPPRSAYRIAVVVDLVGGGFCELGSWSGVLDGHGRGVLPAAALGPRTEPVAVVAWCRAAGSVATWVRTPVLVVQPD